MNKIPIVLTILTPHLHQAYQILQQLHIFPIINLGETDNSTYLKVEMTDRQLARFERLDFTWIECVHRTVFN